MTHLEIIQKAIAQLKGADSVEEFFEALKDGGTALLNAETELRARVERTLAQLPDDTVTIALAQLQARVDVAHALLMFGNSPETYAKPHVREELEQLDNYQSGDEDEGDAPPHKGGSGDLW